MDGIKEDEVYRREAGQAPFPGLSTFDADHAHLFIGRDNEVDDLMARLRASRFLAVVGGSGTGKSSLVRAGLLPALQRGRFHDGDAWAERWPVAILRPADDPFRQLASALPDLQPGQGAAKRIRFREECERQLERKGGLHNVVASIDSRRPEGQTSWSLHVSHDFGFSRPRPPGRNGKRPASQRCGPERDIRHDTLAHRPR